MLKPTEQQLIERLQRYADDNGRTWKAKLVDMWERGDDSGDLRTARNVLGPRWLYSAACKIKPSAAA